jgi:hypothetical protein
MYCKESIQNSKEIFPEKEFSNFYIHVSVSNLYIPTINRLFTWEHINRIFVAVCSFNPLTPGSWAVVEEPDRLLRFLAVNPAGGQDPQLAGWLKVRGGQAVQPPASLLQRAVHVRTVHCQNQARPENPPSTDVED